MTEYTAILLYNSPELNRLFNQDDALLQRSLAHAANVPDIKISRDTYEDGTWSWWYRVTSASLSSDSLKKLAVNLNNLPGISGGIMLSTATGEFEFLRPVPTDQRGFGAKDPAEFKTGHDPMEKPANDKPKKQQPPKRFTL